jgi:hypothetical protein
MVNCTLGAPFNGLGRLHKVVNEWNAGWKLLRSLRISPKLSKNEDRLMKLGIS